jgi:hypothetical protein
LFRVGLGLVWGKFRVSLGLFLVGLGLFSLGLVYGLFREGYVGLVYSWFRVIYGYLGLFMVI